MVDGIYTHRGREPLPPDGAPGGSGKPVRKLVAFWGALTLGVVLLGMTIGGFIKRKKRRSR